MRFAALLLLVTAPAVAQEKAGRQRCPRPAEVALVFSFGYGSDRMPADDRDFERLLQTIKDGGFNAVHCTYTESRLALCKKHGVKMMIDLLAEPHVYKNPDKAKALCTALRGNADVWGYNVWNDNFGKSAAGRQRDIDNVRAWDATHPAYCGTYRTQGMSGLPEPDMMGYYDFHWKRGLGRHFPHLLAYWNWSRQKDACFCAWLSATSGQPGEGNFRRNLYSANTSLAFGLKGVLWFLGTDIMDARTLRWTARGQDIIKVNKELRPLARELGRLGVPSAVYSTPVSRSPNNEALPGAAALPAGLGGHEFPKDFWVRPGGGEFLLGVFEDGKGRTALFVANHNAYVGQEVVLEVGSAKAVRLFDRAAGTWRGLEVRQGRVRLSVAAGGGELLHVEKQ
jgi:hypothetical protein